MKKTLLILSLAVANLCATASSVYQTDDKALIAQLNPRPHTVELVGKSLPLAESYTLRTQKTLAESPALTLLRSSIPLSPKGGLSLRLGLTSDKTLGKYARRVPNKAEAYYLHVGADGIVLVGADRRGLYYGVQTLLQLFQQGTAEGKPKALPYLDIADAPDVAWRGVVEGFYGTPWSHQARLSQLDYYGHHKLNVYIYGPKDDPYHSVPRWREPYPEAEAKQLQELVARAKQNEVTFYWAIHPGQDIKWNEEDRERLIRKFEHMYQLGVRGFAVFFDDISGEGTRADKQAELLNYINRYFIRPKGDVAPLVMCPTEYNKSWSNIEKGYLPTLGRELDKDIEIMWTGNTVVTTIDKPDMDWINQHIQRKAYIWFNFPVSDFVRNHMLLGATYGNSLEIAEDVSGFLSNPMEHAEASKIALYSVADYTWNMRAYDSDASWRKAIAHVTKTAHGAKALQSIAEYSSDLGPNGHRFRREESLQRASLLDSIVAGYYDAKQAQQIRLIGRELIRASDVLLTGEDNAELTRELRPWLNMAGLLGRYAREIADMYEYAHSDNKAGLTDAFSDAYHQSRALKIRMQQLDASENINPYQPGVRIATRRLQPALDSMLLRAVTMYNTAVGTRYASQLDYLPYDYSSDVPQLKSQSMNARGNVLNLSPSNEVIKWERGQSLLLQARQAKQFEQIMIDLGQLEVSHHFRLIAIDEQGREMILPLSQEADRKVILVDLKPLQGCKVRSLQLRLEGADSLDVYLRRYAVVLGQ